MAGIQIGQVLLEQFRVDAFVAAGGMGAVYKVWDLKRQVPLAMKVLHADLAEDPSIFKRFKREANALKKLAHPNIVPFYGLYETLDFAFLLEGYVDGPTLKEVLKRKGRLSVEEALTVLKGVSAALTYAHAHGVVHCDVKPGNVMIDRGGRVYLTDFGIARHAESMTTTFGFAGTAAYMAPEQIRGEVVTPATDVYALGVMAYELLVGRRPFTGEEEGTAGTATRAERLRMAHLKLAPPDPRQFNAELPEEVAQVLLKALNKAPEERYSDAWAFFEALCEAFDKTPTEVSNRLLLSGWEKWETVQQAAEGFAPEFDSVTAKSFTVSGLRLPWWGGVLIGILVGGLALGIIGIWVVFGKVQTPTRLPEQEDQENRSAVLSDTSEILSPLGTPTLTSTPTWTPSPTSTFTPTPTFTPSPTPYVPQISVSNVGRLVEIDEMYGHSEWIWDLAFSPDGTYLASASADGTVGVWKVNGWRKIKTLVHDADVVGVAFSPDGRYLASTSMDGTVKIWRVGSWGLAKAIYHGDKTYKVAFSPDGRFLVYGAANRRAEVWRVSGWSRAYTLFHSNDVFCLAISPNSQWLATGERDGALRIWRLSDGEKVITLWHGDDVNGLAFSPDGRFLASVSDDGTVRLWKVGSWTQVWKQYQGDKAFSVAFSPDGKLLVTGGKGGTLKFWRVSNGALLRTLSVPVQKIWSVEFSPDGQWLVHRSNEGSIQVWGLP